MNEPFWRSMESWSNWLKAQIKDDDNEDCFLSCKDCLFSRLRSSSVTRCIIHNGVGMKAFDGSKWNILHYINQYMPIQKFHGESTDVIWGQLMNWCKQEENQIRKTILKSGLYDDKHNGFDITVDKLFISRRTVPRFLNWHARLRGQFQSGLTVGRLRSSCCCHGVCILLNP